MIEVKISADNKYYLLVKGANGENLSQTETLESTRAVLTNAYAQDIALYDRCIKIGDFIGHTENTDDEILRAAMRELRLKHMEALESSMPTNLWGSEDAKRFAVDFAGFKDNPLAELKASDVLKARICQHGKLITVILVNVKFMDQLDAEKALDRFDKTYYFYGHKMGVFINPEDIDILIY